MVPFFFAKVGRNQESRADTLLAVAFAAWGILVGLTSVQPLIPYLSTKNFGLFVVVRQFFTGVLMGMGVYEEQRRRAERNMLALSSLNLATSSFGGGEIQKMLAQTLDRVLNVARIPAGALCLHYGDPDGPASVVTTGLGGTFSEAMQSGRLDVYVVKMVARLGGLMVLAELDRDSNWEALEREPAFKEIRKQFLAQVLYAVG